MSLSNCSISTSRNKDFLDRNIPSPLFPKLSCQITFEIKLRLYALKAAVPRLPGKMLQFLGCPPPLWLRYPHLNLKSVTKPQSFGHVLRTEAVRLAQLCRGACVCARMDCPVFMSGANNQTTYQMLFVKSTFSKMGWGLCRNATV